MTPTNPTDLQDPRIHGGTDDKGRFADVAANPKTLNVVEETARIEVVRRDAGGLRVSVVTDAVEQLQRVDLRSERVEVTRHPAGVEIDAIPEARTEGAVTILPVVEERAVVVTKLFLVEELHIRRVQSTETVEVPVNLRRQQAVVEQLAPEADGAAAPGSDDRIS